MRLAAFILAVAFAVALLASSVPAQEVPMANVSFTLAIIDASATEGDPEVDPQLKDIKDALLAATKYKKFDLVSSAPYVRPPGSQIGPVKLAGGYFLTMVTQAKGRFTAVRAVITHEKDKKKPLIDYTVILKKGKPGFVEVPVADDHAVILCFIGR